MSNSTLLFNFLLKHYTNLERKRLGLPVLGTPPKVIHYRKIAIWGTGYHFGFVTSSITHFNFPERALWICPDEFTEEDFRYDLMWWIGNEWANAIQKSIVIVDPNTGAAYWNKDLRIESFWAEDIFPAWLKSWYFWADVLTYFIDFLHTIEKSIVFFLRDFHETWINPVVLKYDFIFNPLSSFFGKVNWYIIDLLKFHIVPGESWLVNQVWEIFIKYPSTQINNVFKEMNSFVKNFISTNFGESSLYHYEQFLLTSNHSLDCFFYPFYDTFLSKWFLKILISIELTYYDISFYCTKTFIYPKTMLFEPFCDFVFSIIFYIYLEPVRIFIQQRELYNQSRHKWLITYLYEKIVDYEYLEALSAFLAKMEIFILKLKIVMIINEIYYHFLISLSEYYNEQGTHSLSNNLYDIWLWESTGGRHNIFYWLFFFSPIVGSLLYFYILPTFFPKTFTITLPNKINNKYMSFRSYLEKKSEEYKIKSAELRKQTDKSIEVLKLEREKQKAVNFVLKYHHHIDTLWFSPKEYTAYVKKHKEEYNKNILILSKEGDGPYAVQYRDIIINHWENNINLVIQKCEELLNEFLKDFVNDNLTKVMEEDYDLINSYKKKKENIIEVEYIDEKGEKRKAWISEYERVDEDKYWDKQYGKEVIKDKFNRPKFTNEITPNLGMQPFREEEVYWGKILGDIRKELSNESEKLLLSVPKGTIFSDIVENIGMENFDFKKETSTITVPSKEGLPIRLKMWSPDKIKEFLKEARKVPGNVAEPLVDNIMTKAEGAEKDIYLLVRSTTVNNAGLEKRNSLIFPFPEYWEGTEDRD